MEGSSREFTVASYSLIMITFSKDLSKGVIAYSERSWIRDL